MRFLTKTYGVDFPEHDTEMSLSAGEMKVVYLVTMKEQVHKVERVFRKASG